MRSAAAPGRSGASASDPRVRLAVLVGGTLGTGLRAGLATLDGALTSGAPDPTTWPVGTLIANILGTLLLAMATGAWSHQAPTPWRVGVTTGLLGAFTTFSALAVQADVLFGAAAWRGLALVVTSIVLGLAAAVTGLRVGRAAAARTRS